MAVAKPPRQYHHQMVHFLRKSFTYVDDGSELDVGTIPAGSLIVSPMSGIQVSTAFDAGTGNVADMGTNGGGSGASDDPDAFMTDGALGTVAFVPMDVSAAPYLVTADTNITVSVALTGTAATAGEAEAIVCYIPDSDG